MESSDYFHSIALRSFDLAGNGAWIEPDPLIDFTGPTGEESDIGEVDEAIFPQNEVSHLPAYPARHSENISPASSSIYRENIASVSAPEQQENMAPTDSNINRENLHAKNFLNLTPEKNVILPESGPANTASALLSNKDIDRRAGESQTHKQIISPSPDESPATSVRPPEFKIPGQDLKVQKENTSTEIKKYMTPSTELERGPAKPSGEKIFSTTRSPSILPAKDRLVEAYKKRDDEKKTGKLMIGQIIVEVIAPAKPPVMVKERVIERRTAAQQSIPPQSPGKFYFGLGLI